MKKRTEAIAFILISIGTLGLLINEFAVLWGRPVTLFLAALNFIGLVLWLVGKQK